MKTNKLIIAISLITYCVLFYQQYIGVNFLLFAVVTITCLIIKDKTIIHNKVWIALAIGSIIGGIGTTLYGHLLSAITSAVSLLLLSSMAYLKNASLNFTLLHSIYSYLSFPYSLYERITDKAVPQNNSSKINIKSWLAILIPIVIVSIFFFLYKSANPMFDQLTQKINLDFLSWGLIRFAFIGWVLIYIYYNQKGILQLIDKDLLISENLSESTITQSFSLFKSTKSEYQSAILLFGLLNILLCIVNILDMQFLFVNHELPKGVSHSEFVHQGINMLIVSIIIAIIITLYYFRGSLHFIKNNTWLKWLAYLWIFQNILLALSSASKNNFYISDYGLTYKRIGVYIYLILTIIGLITTMIKITYTKSNWFLVRKNTWAFYFILLICSLVHWDYYIIRYNTQMAKYNEKEYLFQLSDNCIKTLLDGRKNEARKNLYKNYSIVQTNKVFYDNLEKRKKAFLLLHKYKQWPSWNLNNENIYQQLK